MVSSSGQGVTSSQRVVVFVALVAVVLVLTLHSTVPSSKYPSRQEQLPPLSWRLEFAGHDVQAEAPPPEHVAQLGSQALHVVVPSSKNPSRQSHVPMLLGLVVRCELSGHVAQAPLPAPEHVPQL